jgi:hypothetical protein
MQDGTGDTFPVGLNSLCLNSPCYLLVKLSFLAACIAPHWYLSRAAISPPACIYRTLRPNDSSPTCIGDGIFHPFHLHASWRTEYLYSLMSQVCIKSEQACLVRKLPPYLSCIFPYLGQSAYYLMNWLILCVKRCYWESYQFPSLLLLGCV